jgi:hypothetical protein
MYMPPDDWACTTQGVTKAKTAARTAAERRGDTFTGFKDLYLKAKASIWV